MREIKIGRNSWGCPLLGISPPGTVKQDRWVVEINEGGRWFSALLIVGRELILAFAFRFFVGAIHWHKDRGLKPKVKRWNG